MATQELLPFWSIVEQLRQCCADRLTGTVFIVSDDNRMAQVHLDSGNIVMLLCRGRRGLDALAAMRTMLHARLRFDDSLVTASDTEQLDTRAVIDQLGLGAEAGRQDAPVRLPGAGPATIVAAEVVAPAARAQAATPVSAAASATLERLLVHYIGPMAQIVYADHAGQTHELRALVTALAGEIQDQRQAEAFLRDAAAALALGPA